MGLGFKKGERIGIWSTNNIEWLLLQMATVHIGVVLVNINPAYRTLELAHALQQSEVHGLFVIPSFRSSNYISMLVEIIPELKTHTSSIGFFAENATIPFGSGYPRAMNITGL